MRTGANPAFLGFDRNLGSMPRNLPTSGALPGSDHRPRRSELAEIGRKELTEGAERSIAFEQQFLLEGNHPSPASSGEPTVAKALDAYEAHVKAKMLVVPDPEEGLEGRRLSDSGQSYLKQIGQIRAHNAEQLSWPISRLTFQGCDAMLEVWRQRPPKKDESGLMTIKTCQEHAKLLKRFFRWLSKSDDFDWTKPSRLRRTVAGNLSHQPGQVRPHHGRGTQGQDVHGRGTGGSQSICHPHRAVPPVVRAEPRVQADGVCDPPGRRNPPPACFTTSPSTSTSSSPRKIPSSGGCAPRPRFTASGFCGH